VVYTVQNDPDARGDSDFELNFFLTFEMRQPRRERIITHGLEDQKEESFMGLKNRLEILDELQNIYGNDPEMMPQIQKMKVSVKQDILLLLH
jgi:hypothetical protein